MKVTDFRNTWCRATKENFYTLYALDIDEAWGWTWERLFNQDLFEQTDVLVIMHRLNQYKKAFKWGKCDYDGLKELKEIHLVNGQFEYVEQKAPRVSIQNANKYKEEK